MRWNNDNKEKLISLWESNTDEELASIFETTIGSIQKERRRLRLIRKPKKIRNTKIYTYEEVKDLFKYKNYILKSDKYTNYTTKLEYICLSHPEEGIQKISLCDFLRNRGCKKCGRERTINAKKHSETELIKECEKRDFKYVDNYVKNQVTYVQYICNKHPHIGVQEKAINNFSICFNCPHCKASKGESALALLLDKHHIRFKTQYRFNDCKDKYPLPFDFYLLDYNICMEYDGELHYVPLYLSQWSKEEAEEKLSEIQRRDNIKTEYCKSKNIPLIRIPYWELNNMECFLLQQFKDYSIAI